MHYNIIISGKNIIHFIGHVINIYRQMILYLKVC